MFLFRSWRWCVLSAWYMHRVTVVHRKLLTQLWVNLLSLRNENCNKCCFVTNCTESRAGLSLSVTFHWQVMMRMVTTLKHFFVLPWKKKSSWKHVSRCDNILFFCKRNSALKKHHHCNIMQLKTCGRVSTNLKLSDTLIAAGWVLMKKEREREDASTHAVHHVPFHQLLTVTVNKRYLTTWRVCFSLRKIFLFACFVSVFYPWYII